MPYAQPFAASDPLSPGPRMHWYIKGQQVHRRAFLVRKLYHAALLGGDL